LSGNNAANNEVSIVLSSSSGNTLTDNNIVNDLYGIGFDSSSRNTLSGNNVANNHDGIVLYYSSDNSVFHNNFVNNSVQVYVDSSNSTWDDGFPSGGNYWSGYHGTDVSRGPFQNESGSDGIGDTPYIIDGNNLDKFPLMKPYPWAAHDVGVTSVETSKNVIGRGYNASINIMMFNYGDYTENINATIYANQTAIGETHNAQLTSVNFRIIRFTWNTTGFSMGNYTISAHTEPVQGETDTSDNTLADGLITVMIPGDLDADLQVQRADLVILSNAYGSRAGDRKWNPNADIDGNSFVGLSDLVILAQHYGEQYSVQEQTRDAVVAYIEANHPEAVQFIQSLSWTGGNTTPEGMVGAETYSYSSDGWNVAMQCPVVPNPTCSITANYTTLGPRAKTTVAWQGTWQNGTVTETSYYFSP
jgi:parallel beta-helix repeat protein